MYRILYAVSMIPTLLLQWRQFSKRLRGSRPIAEKWRSVVELFREICWPWLSARIPSERTVARSVWGTSHQTYSERLRRLLQRNSSYKRAIVAFLLVTAILVGLAAGIGLLDDSTVDSSDTTADGLLTIAEVLGGIAGILIAVVIFGVQFHGERAGEAAFLVKSYSTRQGIVAFATVFLAVICGNLVVGLGIADVIPHSADAMALLDAILAAPCLAIVLWLLHENVHGVSGDILNQSMLPALRYDYERYVTTDVRQRVAQRALIEELDKIGIEHDASAMWSAVRCDGKTTIRPLRSGVLTDVNLTQLSRCQDVITTSVSGTIPHFLLEMYRDVQSNFGIVLSPNDDETDIVLNDVHLLSLRRRLDQCLAIESGELHPFAVDLEKVTIVARDSAVSSPVAEFRRWLSLLRTLIEVDVHRPREVRIAPQLKVECPPLIDFRFIVHDLRKNVARANDSTKTAELFDWGRHLIHLGIESDSLEVIDLGGVTIWGIYKHSLESGAQKKEVARWVDEALHGVLSRLNCRRTYLRSLDVTVKPGEILLLERLLQWALACTKLAIEFGSARDATNFLDRIFEFDKYHELQRLQIDSPDCHSPRLVDSGRLHENLLRRKL